MGNREWVFCRYHLTENKWVESWCEYETFYIPEIKCWCVKKIYEKDKKIVEGEKHCN